MSIEKGLLITSLLLFSLSTVFTNSEITICIDNNSWIPFTYLYSEEPSGIHVELAKKALNDLGYSVIFTSMPWNRCLYEVEHGLFDAVLSVSYKEDRSEYLYYPDDADISEKSPLRVTSAEYVIVTHIENSYQWNGDDLSTDIP